MAQTAALVDTLKKQLKASGKTYADVAQALELSEASVKRLFSEHNFTLQRIDSICELMGIDMADLVLQMSARRQQLTALTKEQEQQIANDMVLLLVTVCVINGFTWNDLLEHYELEETLLIQKLAQLDRLKIIDLLPGNRIKRRIAPNFNWLPNGPIQQFFREKVEQDFFSSRFDKKNEKLVVINGLLSPSGNADIQKKLQKLSHEFTEQMAADSDLPIEQRFGNTMVLAIRQWNYSMFKPLKKK